MRAIHLKSFDYRVLNLLLYQLRGAKVISCNTFFVVISWELINSVNTYSASHVITVDIFTNIVPNPKKEKK